MSSQSSELIGRVSLWILGFWAVSAAVVGRLAFKDSSGFGIGMYVLVMFVPFSFLMIVIAFVLALIGVIRGARRQESYRKSLLASALSALLLILGSVPAYLAAQILMRP